MKSFRFEYQFDVNGRIDDANGVVHGVSLITMGNARGHNLEVDETTLEQLKISLENTPAPGIKAKLNHRSGVEAVFGYIKNFHVIGDKLTGDLHMLKAHKDYNQTMEQIKTLPKQIGLSVAFQGDKEPGANGKTYARCKRIVSVDLVSDPAANPNGMFETKKVDRKQQNMDEELQAQLQAIISGQQELAARLDGIEQFNADIEEAIELNLGELDDAEYEDAEYDDAEYDDAEYEDDEYDDYDEYDDEESVEYSALDNMLTYLEAKADGALQAEQDARYNAAFDVIEDKVSLLAERNEELELQNEALQEALEMDGIQPLDASSEAHLFESGADAGTFEFQIQAETEDANSPQEAIRSACTNNPAAHQDWLRRQGVIA